MIRRVDKECYLQPGQLGSCDGDAQRVGAVGDDTALQVEPYLPRRGHVAIANLSACIQNQSKM
jgi:hypothetical protein